MTVQEDMNTPEEYLYALQRVIRKQQAMYKAQIQTDEVTVKTRDLESLINDLASGKEKPWVNKLINNGE